MHENLAYMTTVILDTTNVIYHSSAQYIYLYIVNWTYHHWKHAGGAWDTYKADRRYQGTNSLVLQVEINKLTITIYLFDVSD